MVKRGNKAATTRDELKIAKKTNAEMGKLLEVLHTEVFLGERDKY